MDALLPAHDRFEQSLVGTSGSNSKRNSLFTKSYLPDEGSDNEESTQPENVKLTNVSLHFAERMSALIMHRVARFGEWLDTDESVDRHPAVYNAELKRLYYKQQNAPKNIIPWLHDFIHQSISSLSDMDDAPRLSDPARPLSPSVKRTDSNSKHTPIPESTAKTSTSPSFLSKTLPEQEEAEAGVFLGTLKAGLTSPSAKDSNKLAVLPLRVFTSSQANARQTGHLLCETALSHEEVIIIIAHHSIFICLFCLSLSCLIISCHINVDCYIYIYIYI